VNLAEQRIEELESKRITLNQRLMDAQTVQEANDIEPELWAVRAAISHYQSRLRGRSSSGDVVQSFH
jgi:hypothetical protein